MKHKIPQPYRAVGEADAYIKGAKAAAEALGFHVDSKAWGGGVPMDLTLYEPSDVKPKVVEVDEETKYMTMDVTSEVNPDMEGEQNG